MALNAFQWWILLNYIFKYPPEFEQKFFWFIKITPGMNVDIGTMLLTDILVYIATILTFYHSYKKYGFWKSFLFLTGSFVYTGLEETIWVYVGFQGNWGIPAFLTGNVYPPTYYWNYYKALTWFLAIPVNACFGWYFIAYGTVYLVETVIPEWDVNTNSGLFKISLVAGLLAMNMDLFIDPIMVRNESWYWLTSLKQNLYVFGIPIFNFVGWFLLIFFFSLYWNKLVSYEEKWGRNKTILVFYVGLVGLLFATIYLILIVAALLTPLYGINLSIPGAGGLI
ncbi:MAG: carotenoid biosynthesis protein [Promethearchaeota archaeon]